MSGDPLSSDKTGEERRQFLPDLPQSLRKDGGEDRVARTERESDNRRREQKRQTCWCCRDQQRACRMAQASAEKLEGLTYWACQKGKSGLSATERAVGKNAGATLAKRKRNKAVCPKHQIMKGGELRWVRAAPWREKGDQGESMERKGWTPP